MVAATEEEGSGSPLGVLLFERGPLSPEIPFAPASVASATAPVLCLVRVRSCVALQDVRNAEAVGPVPLPNQVPLRTLLCHLPYECVTCPPCMFHIPTDWYTDSPFT